jgi:CTP synthase (UTP-ammonia lyase)
MGHNLNIAIIGDYDGAYAPHLATEKAVLHAANLLAIEPKITWMDTLELKGAASKQLVPFDAIWCGPGSPYKSMEGAMEVIQYARENNIPFLGTCSGFQHVIVEYVRNVLKQKTATHQEYEPNATDAAVNLLNCAIKTDFIHIILDETSKAFRFYGKKDKITEATHCNYGLNLVYQAPLHANGLKIVGFDKENHKARVVEIAENDFFVATLYLPQMISKENMPHPLVNSLLEAAIQKNLRIK